MIGYTVSALQISANRCTAFLLAQALSMRQVASQVFWLTRVCQGNANFPKRLPTTTGWANNVAGTGHRVHLKGWEYCEA